MLFERATKLKLRFDTSKGNLSTEDLWDMPLVDSEGWCLDEVAKSLNRNLKEDEEESFVVKKSSSNDVLNLKFSIVKHIIEKKLEDIEKAENRAANKARKQEILNILAEKDSAADKRKSKAALLKELEDL